MNTVHTLDLPLRDARAAHALAASCLEVYKAADDPRFLDEAPVLAHDLPLTVRRHLNSARRDETTHATLIRGNTVDQAALGATPAHWSQADTEASQVHGCLLVLYAALLGDLTGWATQQAGRLVTDILPSKGYETSLISASSALELAWHTEDAFSPYRADWVGLFALRNEDRIPTTVAHLDVRRLPDRVRDVLSRPRFLALPDAAHTFTDGAFVPEPVPVLDGHRDQPVLRIDRDFFRAQDGDTEAAEALAWITAHLDANLTDVVLPTGAVCFVDNRNAVHGRRSFRAGFDGGDRWLKRVNLVRDLRRTRPGRIDGSTRVIG
ncbi:TauD/TfdA family dioxygenase [Streptomyces brasiliensis]|uniref:L-asparagine oxygenase n=1 Tax=Streptomyces brasiliensis TaxID=1954 RepID=A0A917LBP6_9ACTN|nr:TauD/TfdA family dioxygenase [Streptomyces brasiliensis]GGJ51625.1 L-asparagine oxygenase [Streptomyces brasiliensis]